MVLVLSDDDSGMHAQTIWVNRWTNQWLSFWIA
jgi:hypothetical protein